MIKHWAKLSCLALCGQLMATACTTDNDDDGTNNTASGGSGGTGGSSTTASGGSAGEAPTTTTASGGSTGGSASGGSASGGTASGGSASGGTASGGTASGGSAGDGNEAGSAGAAGASTEGYDGGQITDIVGPETVTNGGTFTVQVTIPGADEEQTFQVAVNGEAGDNVTSTPNDDGVFDISFAVPDDADGDQVTVTITPLDADGDAGSSAEVESDLIESGTGDLKVTLSFDQSTDLDLYVLEPDGTQISFDAPQSPSGGTLDIDSNPECIIDGINLENVFWPSGSAPEGEYLVGVNYYEACVDETVNFTVTITNGDDIETITGSFEAAEAGPESEIVTVATFTVD